VTTDLQIVRERLEEVWSVSSDHKTVCAAILDFLSGHAHETTHIDFARLLSLARSHSVSDPDKVLSVARYLSGPDCHLLDMKFEFISDDDEPLDDTFSVEELAQIKRAGEFTNPCTGKIEGNFEDKFYFFFVPSPFAKSLFPISEAD
jgi:hypothetical protein